MPLYWRAYGPSIARRDFQGSRTCCGGLASTVPPIKMAIARGRDAMAALPKLWGVAAVG